MESLHQNHGASRKTMGAIQLVESSVSRVLAVP
jgi:hypothetical protein